MPVIILKLDDICRIGAVGDAPVSERWQRVTDYLEQGKIKASYGVCGFSLDEDVPEYFEWLKERHRKGIIELWNHGYVDRNSTDEPAEFEIGTVEDQRAILVRTQELGKKKLDITFRAFGLHWSGCNANTVKALDLVPELTMVFYEPKGTGKYLFPRPMNLEFPCGVPDPVPVARAASARGIPVPPHAEACGLPLESNMSLENPTSVPNPVPVARAASARGIPVLPHAEACGLPLESNMNLENPTSVPNPVPVARVASARGIPVPPHAEACGLPLESNMSRSTKPDSSHKFKQAYESIGCKQPCLPLQGHPNKWGDVEWQGFVEIIKYLKDKGCVFMKLAEYAG